MPVGADSVVAKQPESDLFSSESDPMTLIRSPIRSTPYFFIVIVAVVVVVVVVVVAAFFSPHWFRSVHSPPSRVSLAMCCCSFPALVWPDIHHHLKLTRTVRVATNFFDTVRQPVYTESASVCMEAIAFRLEAISRNGRGARR